MGSLSSVPVGSGRDGLGSAHSRSGYGVRSSVDPGVAHETSMPFSPEFLRGPWELHRNSDCSERPPALFERITRFGRLLVPLLSIAPAVVGRPRDMTDRAQDLDRELSLDGCR